MKTSSILILFILIHFTAKAQMLEQIGSLNSSSPKGGSVFDLSDPKAVNIKVSVWGAVRNPGYYIIPDYTDMKIFISVAGGPLESAKLQDMRIFRVEKDSSVKIISFNFEDAMWGTELKNYKAAPALKAGDVLMIPAEQRYSFKDYLQYGFSIVSILLAVVNIIIISRR